MGLQTLPAVDEDQSALLRAMLPGRVITKDKAFDLATNRLFSLKEICLPTFCCWGEILGNRKGGNDYLVS